MTNDRVELFWISLFEGERQVGNVCEGLSLAAAEEYVACYNRLYSSSDRHAEIVRFCLPAMSGRPLPQSAPA